MSDRRTKYTKHAISESLQCYLSLVTWVPGVQKTLHPVFVRLIRGRYSEDVPGFSLKKNVCGFVVLWSFLGGRAERGEEITREGTEVC